MFEVWLQMSDTNIDRENPSDLPALIIGDNSEKKLKQKRVALSEFSTEDYVILLSTL